MAFLANLLSLPVQTCKSRLLSSCAGNVGPSFVRRIRFIHSSSVPVIKVLASSGDTVGTGVPVNVDISGMGNTHLGLRARSYLRDRIFQWPRMRVLSIFLKQLLYDNNTSNAVVGGFKSFALMILLVRFYQHVEEREKGQESFSNEDDEDCGHTEPLASDLMAFLELYGNFDFSKDGVDVNGKGAFFSLQEAGMFNVAPCCIMWGDRNVAANASDIFSVQQLFRKTLGKLKRGVKLSNLVRIRI